MHAGLDLGLGSHAGLDYARRPWIGAVFEIDGEQCKSFSNAFEYFLKLTWPGGLLEPLTAPVNWQKINALLGEIACTAKCFVSSTHIKDCDGLSSSGAVTRPHAEESLR
jgi:hypothetical protein